MTAALETATAVYMGLLGACAGSFLGVVADRIPRGESIVQPPSRCLSCDRRLGVIDLLPIAGWILRRGRCAGCGARIPMAALAGELACALAASLPVIAFPGFTGVVAGLGCLVLLSAGTFVSASSRRVRA